jgi:ubiquitin carboxyl-terminal hydrolase 14
MTIATENVLKVECNITVSTNYMFTGIMNVGAFAAFAPWGSLMTNLPFRQSLDQKVDKLSPSLGREAVYTQHSRLTRLPAYLTVHMVRFAWRADIQKKAKIMVRPSLSLCCAAMDHSWRE